MLFLLLQAVFTLKPLILVSGFNGSPLYATVKKDELDNSLKEKCPEGLDHYQFYPPTDKNFYMQYPDCQVLLMRAFYDDKDRKVTYTKGVKVESSPFGNYSQLLNFDTIVKHAISIGYTPQKDLFGVGYNFMLHPLDNGNTFDQIKENAERIVKEVGEKIVFISHSQGTHFVSQFLSNFSKPDWVSQYIDSAIFVAPAFAGSGNYRRLIDKEYGQFITTAGMKQAIMNMPGQHILLPNYVAYGNKTVIYNYPSSGAEATARDVPAFLRSVGSMNDESEKIFKEVEKFLSQPIPEPPIKSYILYNSGINTGSAYRIDRVTNQVKVVMGPGDGDYTPEGAVLACNTWSNVVCYNWEMNKASFNHASMLNVQKSVDMIFDYIGNDLDHTPDSTANPNAGMYAIMYGTPVILGLQVIVVVAAVIFIIKNGGKSIGPDGEAAAWKASAQL